MHDTISLQPDMIELFQMAIGQQGFFTAEQARKAGVSNDLVQYHLRTGRFVRAYRGVYRFRDYPPSPREHVAAAWLAVGRDTAVVSHESALDLHQLSDVTPNTIDITIPRSRRYLAAPQGITVHTTVHPIDPRDISYVDGIPVTSPARTIVDVAEAGTSEEHVQMAVAQVLHRGTASARRLQRAAAPRSERVRDMINRALASVAA